VVTAPLVVAGGHSWLSDEFGVCAENVRNVFAFTAFRHSRNRATGMVATRCLAVLLNRALYSTFLIIILSLSRRLVYSRCESKATYNDPWDDLENSSWPTDSLMQRERERKTILR